MDKINKHSLLLVVDLQEKYKKLLPLNILNNIKLLINYFNEYNLQIAWTRYSRCLKMSYCRETPEKTALSYVLDYYDMNSREKTDFKYGNKLWELIPEAHPNPNRDNNHIFDSNQLNIWNNKYFTDFIHEKKIKNVVIVGGWASYCIISNIQLALNFNIVPITVSDAIFDKSEKNLESSLLLIRRNSIYKSTYNLINENQKKNAQKNIKKNIKKSVSKNASSKNASNKNTSTKNSSNKNIKNKK